MKFIHCNFEMVNSLSLSSSTQFTASNVSTAIHAVKPNKGIFMTSLLVALLGVAWTTVLTISGVYAYDYLGKGTLAIFLFSYYWVRLFRFAQYLSWIIHSRKNSHNNSNFNSVPMNINVGTSIASGKFASAIFQLYASHVKLYSYILLWILVSFA